MSFTRREIFASIPFTLLATSLAQAQTEQKLSSGVFPFAGLPIRKDGGNEFRNIVNSTMPTGERVEIHETVLAPGKMPHPAHQHAHSEFWLIREGDVELTINGKTQRIGSGSAAFAAANEMHSIKNVGSKPASYFVVAIGPMPKAG
jgi:mannose-6-phosphate isomerase-like protein (cupin superfamily)